MNRQTDRQRTSRRDRRCQDRFPNLRRRPLPLPLLLGASGGPRGAGPLRGQTKPAPDKWLHPPDTSPKGLDVRGSESNLRTDDFRCAATGIS